MYIKCSILRHPIYRCGYSKRYYWLSDFVQLRNSFLYTKKLDVNYWLIKRFFQWIIIFHFILCFVNARATKFYPRSADFTRSLLLFIRLLAKRQVFLLTSSYSLLYLQYPIRFRVSKYIYISRTWNVGMASWR